MCPLRLNTFAGTVIYAELSASVAGLVYRSVGYAPRIVFIDHDTEILIYSVAQATRFFTKPEVPPVLPDGSPPHASPIDPSLLPPLQAHLAWSLGQPLSMHVRLSALSNDDTNAGRRSSVWRDGENESLPHFVWENITFGNWSDTRVVRFDVELPEVKASFRWGR
jgi:hypothetical protein